MSEKILKSIQLNNHDYVIDAKYLGGKDISDIENCVKITYEGLNHLKNLSNLIPGKQYRITDYITSTSQENTKSAGHQFDIIVTADDVNRLNEKARAIHHEGDTYFKDSNLSAWEIWYCLDNDTNRFSWASRTGKGVIYRMIDEFNNDCTYDFKNIQFARWELSNPVGYRNDFDVENESDNWIIESTPFDSLKTGFYGLNDSTKEFYYAYKNGKDYYEYKVEYTISESPTYCYTFGKDTDYSISGGNYKNVIKEDRYGNKMSLNNIVFLGDICYSNSFGGNCSRNSFGGSCYSNSLGNYCDANSFGGSCSFNSFGNSCSSNSLGRELDRNSFGNGCSSNSLGNYCDANSFGNGCSSNSFGDRCSSNSLGNDCSTNSFGNSCYSNSFGGNCYMNSFSNYCDYNSFGNICSSNSFGNACQSNSFGNNCHYNSFGNSCDSNSFGNSCDSNSFGNNCSNITFGANATTINSYYRYIKVEDGNRYIYLNCSVTLSSSNYFQNVRILLGANNATSSTYSKYYSFAESSQTYERHIGSTSSNS